MTVKKRFNSFFQLLYNKVIFIIYKFIKVFKHIKIKKELIEKKLNNIIFLFNYEKLKNFNFLKGSIPLLFRL